LRQYSNLGRFDLAVNDFRKMLDLENKYKRFNELRRWVLDVARKELNAKAELSFTLETVRKGKTISTLKFTIVRQQKTAKKSRDGAARAGVDSVAKSGDTETKKLEEFEGADKELFNEFLKHVKTHDEFIYNRYLTEGYDMMVKYEYQKFLDK
ncbi:MAG: RepB family plasmid replication initiator protein, partial [Candidatus Electrothrix sp. AS4_5]|nr:RepB family plasmid replication initiator protein [Candidatus Electrothrix gigas]